MATVTPMAMRRPMGIRTPEPRSLER